jgi:hypothetical protein
MKERWKAWQDRLASLGMLGLVVHYICLATFVGLVALGLDMGLAERVPWVAERVGTAGIWIGAYGLAKVLTIPRIALTVAITPFVARRIGYGQAPASSPEPAAPDQPAPPDPTVP